MDRAPNRDYAIDLLKVMAIIGVIIIHTCPAGYNYPIGSFNWLSTLFWGVLMRSCVPVFLMCSGALFLEPRTELTLKKLYLKNLLRILVSMFFWAMAYKVYHLVQEGNFTAALLYRGFLDVLLFRQEFHLYYLHIIILVYIFVPIMRIITQNADKAQLQYLLLVWAVFGIVYPTVRPFWPFRLLSGIPEHWLMNMTYASIGYGVLGHYLKRYPNESARLYVLMFAAGFAFVFAGTWFLSFRRGYLYEGFLEGMTIGPALMAAGVFGFCESRFKASNPKLARTVMYLSQASFCVYLVHAFVLYGFSKAGLTASLFPCLVSIPAIAALNYACCNGIYAALSRIPIARKWLI